jgi:hypothetical protein
MADHEQQQQRAREALDRKAEQDRAEAEAEQVMKPEREPDDQSTRAKSSRHGKVTADKWNQ